MIKLSKKTGRKLIVHKPQKLTRSHTTVEMPARKVYADGSGLILTSREVEMIRKG